MARYIDADKLLNQHHQYFGFFNGEWYVRMRDIEDAPTVDVAEPNKGKWIDMGDFCVCNQCWHREQQFNGVEQIPLHTPFCAMCGARMEGTENV